MKKISFLIALVCMLALFSFAPPTAATEEEPLLYTPEQQLEECAAASAAVYEAGSRSFIYSYNIGQQRPIGHLAKLMAYLIAVEKIEAGELSLTDTAKVSARANSMQGAQIWLDVGEIITVDELMKSIAIGNANDACVALAERIAGTEEDFVSLMNAEAARLGMRDTVFVDSTGLDVGTVSTAADMALLIAELCRYTDSLGPFTVWMDEVRGGKAQLVSLNTLIKSCKGLLGFKIGTLEHSGECAAEAVKRGDRVICAVVLEGARDGDIAAEAERLINKALTDTVFYTPELPEEASRPISVAHGEKRECDVLHGDVQGITLRAEDRETVYCRLSQLSKLTAPVKKGDALGSVSYYVGERYAFSTEIKAGEDIAPVSFGYVFRKILFNLLKN